MTDILEASAVEITQALASRRLSAADLMAATLDRIAALNPEHNAIVALRPREELLAEALAADTAGPRGPLHGLPIAVKDLEDVAGLPTTRGSPILANMFPSEDGPMAARLRAAGAILIGKTNVPEFGLGSYSRNPVYGITRNAYDPALSAGGSSSGASVALALRMLALADGSDYGGSLRNPAGWNNIYGFRPTHGRVPKIELEPRPPALAVLGPMARSVEDLALLFSVQAALPGFSPAPDARGKRIAWAGDFNGRIPFDPGVLELARSSMRVFEDLGAVVEEAAPDFDFDKLWPAFVTLRHWHVSLIRPLYDDPVSRALLPATALYEIESAARQTPADIEAAVRVHAEWQAAFAKLHARYDAVALPTAQCFAFPAEARGADVVAGRTMATYHEWMQSAVPATMAGAPTIAAPAGFNSAGRAMGVQLIGRGEQSVFALARAYDEATRWPYRRRSAALA